ncbi:MAG: undecaprenyl-phosphate glucose phosphotransferase [Prevotella sp.]|nr:undecaprenyl-phosphate glucose phosphotransferase [Prevotella sp.]
MKSTRNTKTNELIKYAVIAGDFIILNLLFAAAFWFHKKYIGERVPYEKFDEFILVINFAMAVSQIRFATVMHERRAAADRIIKQAASLVALYAVLSYAMAKPFIYTGAYGSFLLVFSLLLFVVLVLVRLAERMLLKRFRRMGRNTRSALLIGSDPAILDIYKALVSDPSTGYTVKGYLAEEPAEGFPEELRYLGTYTNLEQQAAKLNIRKKNRPDEIYCCLPRSRSKQIRNVANYCDSNIIRFYYVPVSLERIGMRLEPETVGDHLIFTNHQEPLALPSNRLIKRLFDVVFSILMLCVCIPLFPIIALIIKLQSPHGPILFRQLRTGVNGKSFYCYKFRSMHPNTQANTLQATRDDPRKFPFGSFMRKTNIDELPQFYNVLINQMSVVGPRPHMLHHTQVYRQLIDQYMVRHFVKPGITGWAQVTGFRGETPELWQMQGRVERDIWYIENWTLWLDVRIVWLTFKQAFIHDKNAY